MKKYIYRFPLLVLTFSLLVSCFQVDPKDRVGSKELAEAVKQRKPKRITSSEMASSAHDFAKQIAATQLPVFSDSLCNTKIMMPDSIQGIQFFLWCQNSEKMKSTEREVFEAYEYSVENATPNIQKIKDKAQFLYTLPLIDSTKLRGMWSIWIEQRQVVLNYKNKR